MKNSTIITGKEGERIARYFLEEKGYTCLKENYRYKRCEIDLIMTNHNKDTLVFIEVKFRKNKSFGEPENFVSTSQENRILEAAEIFIEELNWKKHIRFDIISITDSSPQEIEHFEDAF